MLKYKNIFKNNFPLYFIHLFLNSTILTPQFKKELVLNLKEKQNEKMRKVFVGFRRG